LTAPKVFLRTATGLSKNVSLFDAVSINVTYMSVGAALSLVGFTMLALPSVAGVNLVFGSMIAAALAVPQMIVYTMMSRRISRTAGDYVWMSRSLGGFLGSTITLMGVTLETMPYLALIALSAVFAIGSAALSLGYSNTLAIAGANPFGQFALASVLFVTLVLVNILKPRLGFKLISTFYVIGLIGVATGIITLLVAGRAGIANYINSLDLPNTTFSSLTNSYTGPIFDLNTTLLTMPYFALFTYPWFNAAPSVGSELKGRASAWNVPISLVAAFLVVTIPYATMYYVGGFAFTTAALSNPTLVNVVGFNFFTLAMGVSSNFAQSFLIGLSWIVLTVAILAFGVITISRYMLAQSFDRFLPSKLAYVSKYGSPVVAHVLDLVVTVTLIGLAAFLYGTISSLYGAVMASMIYFAFVGIAAVVYGIRKEKSTGSKTVLAVAGTLQTLVFLYLTYEFLAYPTIWGGNPLAYGYITATFILGTLVYGYRKAKSRGGDFNIDLAFKEIPPE